MNALTPRQAKRRDKILSTVRNHLSRYGYDGLNMRSVAEAAGVSPTTLYNQFENKDTLILSALHDLTSQFTADLSDSSARGMARMQQRSEVTAEIVADSPRFSAVINRMLWSAEPDAPIFQTMFDGSVSRVQEEIRDCQDLGELRSDIDVTRLARNVVIGNWATLALWSKGYIALKNLADELGRNLIGSLLPAMTQAQSKKWRDEVVS